MKDHAKDCPVPWWENSDGIEWDMRTTPEECYMCSDNRPRCSRCDHDMNSHICELSPIITNDSLSWECDCKHSMSDPYAKL